MLGRTWKARYWTKITAPRLKSCGFDLNRTSEPSGLAFRQRNRSRFLTDRDSGKRRRPYEALVTEKAAAAQKGYLGPRSATSPPKAGPMMNPIPQAAPTMPKAAARRSGGVTSAKGDGRRTRCGQGPARCRARFMKVEDGGPRT